MAQVDVPNINVAWLVSFDYWTTFPDRTLICKAAEERQNGSSYWTVVRAFTILEVLEGPYLW